MVKKPIPVLIRIPPALVRKLEAASAANHRSRNAEACLRIEDSFKAPKKRPARTGA